MRAWHLSKNNQKEARNEKSNIDLFPLEHVLLPRSTKISKITSPSTAPVSRTTHILSFWVKQGFEKKRWTPHMHTFMLSLKTHDLLHAH